MKRHALALLALLSGLLAGIAAHAQSTPSITLRLDQTGHAVSPKLYGLMTEEINYSYDGGLYAELIRNRIFRDNPMNPDHWTVVEEGDAKGKITLDRQHPINEALTTCLRLDAGARVGQGGTPAGGGGQGGTSAAVGQGGRIGVANDGYWGIPVRPGTSYTASFFAMANRRGPLSVSIESTDGKTVFAKAQSPAIGTGWQRYELVLTTATDLKPSADTRFVISATDTGQYWFNLVSLFPPTYHNTPNGNRPDIMQLLADMHPAFLRFPGGNYVEGDYFSSRFDWKKTIGRLDQRPGHQSPWGYRSTDGMGLYEYLKWCEDIKMEPLLAVFAGYTLKGDYFDDPKFLQPFVDEALEEIEYVIGDKSTKWGAERARDGHPDPFALSYVEIGNEDGFDRSGSYAKRFGQFAAAIRAKYPQLKIISTVGGRNDFLSARFHTPTENVDVVDEHFYRSSLEMQDMATLYDTHDRNGPKIFVGEWASREGFPTTNFHAALGDAAFLTGLERNSDLVIMSCFAPLFVNVNPGGMQWKSDLIGYDALHSFGSPSYYVQKMFNTNLGDQVVNIEASGLPTQVKPPSRRDSAAGIGPKTIPAMFFSATKDTRTGTIFLKVVNSAATTQSLAVHVDGPVKVAAQGKAITLRADAPEDTNSITEPEKIVPVTTTIKGLGKQCKLTIPALSVTIFQIQTK